MSHSDWRRVIAELSEYSNSDIISIFEAVSAEMRQRNARLLVDDPVSLIESQWDELFDSDGHPYDHIIVPGGVVVGCAVWDRSSDGNRHSCCHYTYRPAGDQEGEVWAWDAPSKVGDYRTGDSTGVYISLLPGDRIGRHQMTKRPVTGKPYPVHQRDTPRYYIVADITEDGYPVLETDYTVTPRKLPLPRGN